MLKVVFQREKKIISSIISLLVVAGSLTGFNSNQSKYFPACNRSKSNVQRHTAHLTVPTVGSHLPDQLSCVKCGYTSVAHTQKICSQKL